MKRLGSLPAAGAIALGLLLIIAAPPAAAQPPGVSVTFGGGRVAEHTCPPTSLSLLGAPPDQAVGRIGRSFTGFSPPVSTQSPARSSAWSAGSGTLPHAAQQERRETSFWKVSAASLRPSTIVR
jgi:hypothetical protein